MVSDKLKIALKLGPQPAYRIAQQAGMDSSTLSKLTCGIVRVKRGDPRVIRVGEILGGPPDECFQEEAAHAQEAGGVTCQGR